jgi:hypothetical protein
MVGARQQVLESKNVDIYKRLLNIFGDFCDKYPCGSVDVLFDQLVEKGIKCLPGDARALAILDYMVCQCESSSAGVQKILNMRFIDLPVDLKPIAKKGKRHEICFWCKDGQVSNQIKSLLNFESSKKGSWSNANCEKVELLDTQISEK